MIEQFAEHISPDLKDCSGAVFYSGRDAFSGLKDLYVLGLNPGGDPVKRPDETIARHTDEVLHDKPDRWSEYTCERWLVRGKYQKPGEGGIQSSVVGLIERLGHDPRDVPASNVGFVRSPNFKALRTWARKNGTTPDALFDKCWPFHREVIEHVRPKLILCIGRRAECVARRKTSTFAKVDEFTRKCSRGYLVEVFQNTRGCTLVSARHPSRGISWTKKELDPSDVVRQALEGANVRWSKRDIR